MVKLSSPDDFSATKSYLALTIIIAPSSRSRFFVMGICSWLLIPIDDRGRDNASFAPLAHLVSTVSLGSLALTLKSCINKRYQTLAL